METVRAQLTRLRPAPHPGHALALLAEDENAPFKPDEEVFLITHPAAQEALCHLPVWQRLAASVPLHTLLVDREGHLSLTRHSLAGARPLAQARVDAEDLFDLPLNKPNPTKPSPAALTNEAGRLPQFYRQNPWPLYHPGPPATQQAFQLGGKGFVGISNTGCVCWWTHRVHVGRVLCPEAPGKNLRGIVVDPDNDDRVLMLFPSSDFSQIHLLVVSLGGHDEARIVTFSGKLYEVSELRLQSGALTLMDHGVMKALSLFDGRLIASASMHDLKGTPWFDGERFHSQKDSHVLPSMMLSTPSASIKPSTKHHRITEIVRVGFGVTGGLLLEKEKGRTYTLEVSNQGTLKWSLLLGARGHFKTLQELAIPERSECPLTQATFPDGRRVIYDPHGFLHVCDSGDDAHELSLLLVKGQTAAWQSKGFYYGEQTLLWDESRGANSVLQSRAKKLFRPCEPSLTKH